MQILLPIALMLSAFYLVSSCCCSCDLSGCRPRRDWCPSRRDQTTAPTPPSYCSRSWNVDLWAAFSNPKPSGLSSARAARYFLYASMSMPHGYPRTFHSHGQVARRRRPQTGSSSPNCLCGVQRMITRPSSWVLAAFQSTCLMKSNRS